MAKGLPSLPSLPFHLPRDLPLPLSLPAPRELMAMSETALAHLQASLDSALQMCIAALPAVEEAAWLVIETVFSPRQIAKQLLICAALQTTILSIRLARKGGRYALTIFSKRAAVQRKLYNKMRQANSYGEWKLLAEELDRSEGFDIWRRQPESKLYDCRVLQRSIQELNTLIRKGDVFSLIFRLRGSLNRAQFGMLHEGLFTRAWAGTKLVVEDYHDTVCSALNYVADSDTQAMDIPTEAKLAFFNETRHSYGRTALLLSGGAAMGYYHVGVVKALHENALLPRVLSGASAGSLMVSIIGTRTDSELQQLYDGRSVNMAFFQHSRASRRMNDDVIKRLQFVVPQPLRWVSDVLLSLLLDREGVLKMDTEYFKTVVQSNTGNFTFQEAFDRTGRIINITVAPKNSYDPPRLLNYLTTPHVLVWSAAVASCAVPGIFDATHLLVKEPDGSIRPEDYVSTGTAVPTWSDGSIEADLPMQQLSELFNVNHFIVSQVNPHALLLSTLSFDNSMWHNPAYALLPGTLKFLKSVCRDWLRHIIDFMLFRRLGPVWGFKRGITQLLTQEYQGRDCDVTIMPWKGHINIFQALVTLLRNPTPEEFHVMEIMSERATFPHMSRISSHCRVEVCLEKCVQRLRKRIVEEGLLREKSMHKLSKADRSRTALGGRVPSFYTSPSLVNLSGLSVADPTIYDATHIHTQQHQGHLLQMSSVEELVEDAADAGAGLGLRLEEDTTGADTRAPWVYSPHGNITGRRHSSLSADNLERAAPEAPSGDNNSATIGTDDGEIYKTTSMANFYYKRSKSDDHLREPRSV